MVAYLFWPKETLDCFRALSRESRLRSVFELASLDITVVSMLQSFSSMSLSIGPSIDQDRETRTDVSSSIAMRLLEVEVQCVVSIAPLLQMKNGTNGRSGMT